MKIVCNCYHYVVVDNLFKLSLTHLVIKMVYHFSFLRKHNKFIAFLVDGNVSLRSIAPYALPPGDLLYWLMGWK